MVFSIFYCAENSAPESLWLSLMRAVFPHWRHSLFSYTEYMHPNRKIIIYFDTIHILVYKLAIFRQKVLKGV